MQRPFEYFVIDNKTGKVLEETNTPPLLRQLQTWERIGDGLFELTQTRTAYIDTRYKAKLRLFNYLRKKQGLTPFKYRPFEGTQIGVSIPILNF